MKLLFWFSLSVVFYTYMLYPGWLFLRSRLKPKPVSPKPFFPKLSIVIAVRNGENYLEQKLHNLQQLDYPQELVEVLIVSDGSTDQTNDILRKFVDSRVRSIFLPVHSGKAEALNRAIEVASGAIVVFMDVRQRIATDSLKTLVGNFADPAVGCVSGALMLKGGEETSPRGVGVLLGDGEGHSILGKRGRFNGECDRSTVCGQAEPHSASSNRPHPG